MLSLPSLPISGALVGIGRMIVPNLLVPSFVIVPILLDRRRIVVAALGYQCEVAGAAGLTNEAAVAVVARHLIVHVARVAGRTLLGCRVAVGVGAGLCCGSAGSAGSQSGRLYARKKVGTFHHGCSLSPDETPALILYYRE